MTLGKSDRDKKQYLEISKIKYLHNISYMIIVLGCFSGRMRAQKCFKII